MQHILLKAALFSLFTSSAILTGCTKTRHQTTLPQHCVALKKHCQTGNNSSCEKLTADFLSDTSTCLDTSFKSFIANVCNSTNTDLCFDYAGVVLSNDAMVSSNEMNNNTLKILNEVLTPHCRRDRTHVVCTVLFWHNFIREEQTDENIQLFINKIQRKVQFDDVFASEMLLSYSNYARQKYLDIAVDNVKVECEHNNSDACMFVGLFYHERFQTSCSENCRVYMRKACEMNHGNACGILGSFFDNGDCGSKDKRKAVFYYRRGCELEDEMSCQKYCEKLNRRKATE